MKSTPQYISLKAARYVIEDETGHLPSRQTIYDWVRTKQLQVHTFKPMRTTRGWVMDFLATRRRV